MSQCTHKSTAFQIIATSTHSVLEKHSFYAWFQSVTKKPIFIEKNAQSFTNCIFQANSILEIANFINPKFQSLSFVS